MSVPDPPVGDRRAAWAGATLVVVGVLVAVLFKARCGLPASVADQYLRWCYSDIPPLWFAERLDVGAVPYLQHPVEYPPLTGLWMWLSSIPATGPVSFFWWTVPVLVAAGAVTGALLGREIGVARTCVVALAPTLLVSGAVNWDLPAVALATAGLVAHRRGHDGWAGVAIGAGAAAKLWPVLLLPGLVLGAAGRRGWRGWRAGGRTASGAVGTWVALNAPVALTAPDGWWRFFELSRERPADWDSLWRLGTAWTGTPLDVATLNLAVGVLTAVGVVALLAWTLLADEPERWHVVGLPVVVWFLVAGKVWSPQFSLWLLPLLALSCPRSWELAAFAVADVAVTLTRFPFLGGVLRLEDAGPAWAFETAVVVRAVVVLLVAVLAWRRAVRSAPASRERLALRRTPTPTTP